MLTRILRERQKHNQHALITSLCSVTGWPNTSEEELRSSQRQIHNISARDQTWSIKHIHTYCVFIISSTTRCREVRSVHQSIVQSTLTITKNPKPTLVAPSQKQIQPSLVSRKHIAFGKGGQSQTN